MRVLVTGAYGVIGSACLARLHRDRHDLIGGGRNISAALGQFPFAGWYQTDFTRLTTARAWLPLLDGIDAVVNCVGVLQDGLRDDTRRVQVEATLALFAACEQAGVRRIVHISAAGADATAPTSFMRTKAEAEADLATRDLDWLILRPALVLAPVAYGGTALLRALAAVPWLTPVVAADARIQVVAAEDVADTVALCLPNMGLAHETLELAHPQETTVDDLVRSLRQWLGFRPQRTFAIPYAVARAAALVADVLGWLGWRSPARRTALAELARGVTADPTRWIEATGIRPRSLADILASRPAGPQDRWFAQLYLLKPIAIATLSLFWISSGIIALGPGNDIGLAVMDALGFDAAVSAIAIGAGAMLDIVLGIAVLLRSKARAALQAMLLLSMAYLVTGTAAAPQLWIDPLGPFLKVVPVMLATLFTLAIIEER